MADRNDRSWTDKAAMAAGAAIGSAAIAAALLYARKVRKDASPVANSIPVTKHPPETD